MKTTIDLADDLAVRAKRLAARRGTTLRAVIEDAIRLTLEQEEHTRAYTLPDRSVGGRGLQREFQGKHFSEIREAAYEGRNG